MSLSAKISVYVREGTCGTEAHLHLNLGEVQGSLVVPWGVFFEREHTVITVPPQGGIVATVKQLKRRATKQELKRIGAIDGRRHSGSGSKQHLKSDGSTEKWRMENKFTTAASIPVKLSDLHKLRSECQGWQAPVFNIEFQEKHTGRVKETWVMVPAKTWEKLVNANVDDS
jgi:hypothetical protein